MIKKPRINFIIFCFILLFQPLLFAQTYAEHISKAKQYESQKKWCYALGEYYDAFCSDENIENLRIAYLKYSALRSTIENGNPGFGNFNQFTLHDEWKRLLIDAEKFGSSFNPYTITIGNLEQGDLDYTTRTASYNAKIDYSLGERYKNTIDVIKKGYFKAYRKDWTDLPEKWPEFSVSYNYDSKYDVNGAKIFCREVSEYLFGPTEPRYMNAFAYTNTEVRYQWAVITAGLHDYKFNIVDEHGKELVKGKRWLLGESDYVSFSGITPDIMELIENKKAFVNPIACYLEYGKYNYDDDKGGRSFIKNFPESQLPIENSVFICWNNKDDNFSKNIKKIDSFAENIEQKIEVHNLLKGQFTELNFSDGSANILKTEVTQKLYEKVMGENPSTIKGDNYPVENVSFYDAIYFCNKLSELLGYTPTYSINGKTNISNWNYTPHKGNKIAGEILDIEKHGFLLPHYKSFLTFAAGGTSYIYAGSDIFDEVAWTKENASGTTHPVAQKKANAQGLYDMSGNVSEWCFGRPEEEEYSEYRYYLGGNCFEESTYCKVSGEIKCPLLEKEKRYTNIGFRIMIFNE